LNVVRFRDSRWAALFVVAGTLLFRFLIGLQCPEALAPVGAYLPSDLAIPALMAKRLLDTGEFPFFFWGQNWFGGLDALLHSGAFLIFGESVWAMRMTLLALYALFCLLTYLITSDLFGRRAGLFAVLWCAFPPMFLTELILVPSVSSLEVLVLGSLIIWLTIRLLSCRGSAVRKLLYFVIGFFCGLGWWATPIIVYYLAGCGAFVLFKERWRGLRLGLALTLPGFALGALPFIVYYARDPYSRILGMGEGFHWSRLAFGLKRLFLGLFPSMFDVDRYAAWIPGTQWAVALLYGYAAAFCIIGIIRGRSGEKAATRPVILWVFVALVAIYASSMHAVRDSKHYVVAVFSLAPVAMGYAIGESTNRFRRLVVLLFFALLVGQGALVWMWQVREVSVCTNAAGEKQLLERLLGAGVTRAYAEYTGGSLALTFFSRERVVFANPMQERYRPYELLLDAARAPAFFLEGPDAFVPILSQIGGTGRYFNEGPHHVFYGFEEPKRRYLQIEAGGIRVQSSHATDQAWKILDRNMDNDWSDIQPRTDGMWVQFDLGGARNVGMVRLWNKGQEHGNYALKVSVKVSEDGRKWQTVVPRSQGGYYYWSGPRLYFWEWGYRMELRFGPVSARYIRISQHENSAKFPWLIGEAFIYEDAGERKDDGQAQEDLVRRVLGLRLKRVYADRWISAKVREAGAPGIETVEPFSFGLEVFYNRLKSRVVQWDQATGFVLDESDAESFEKTLVAEGLDMSKEVYGRWALYFFERWGEREEDLKGDPGWWWMGLGVVGTNDEQRSEFFKALGDKRLKRGKPEQAAAYYDKARALRENHR